MPARSIGEILSTAGELESLAEASRRTAQLQRVFMEALPPGLTHSSRIALGRGDVLFVVVDSGAVAAKLKQTAARVLKHLRQSGFEFNSMRIEVQVGQGGQLPGYSRRKPLSDRALSAIDGAIERVSESPLKTALARLARRR